MLTIGRRVGESVVIDGKMLVHVFSSSNRTVELGINPPLPGYDRDLQYRGKRFTLIKIQVGRGRKVSKHVKLYYILHRGGIRLGVEAPRHVSVAREEVDSSYFWTEGSRQ